MEALEQRLPFSVDVDLDFYLNSAPEPPQIRDASFLTYVQKGDISLAQFNAIYGQSNHVETDAISRLDNDVSETTYSFNSQPLSFNSQGDGVVTNSFFTASDSASGKPDKTNGSKAKKTHSGPEGEEIIAPVARPQGPKFPIELPVAGPMYNPDRPVNLTNPQVADGSFTSPIFTGPQFTNSPTGPFRTDGSNQPIVTNTIRPVVARLLGNSDNSPLNNSNDISNNPSQSIFDPTSRVDGRSLLENGSNRSEERAVESRRDWAKALATTPVWFTNQISNPSKSMEDHGVVFASYEATSDFSSQAGLRSVIANLAQKRAAAAHRVNISTPSSQNSANRLRFDDGGEITMPAGLAALEMQKSYVKQSKPAWTGDVGVYQALEIAGDEPISTWDSSWLESNSNVASSEGDEVDTNILAASYLPGGMIALGGFVVAVRRKKAKKQSENQDDFLNSED